MTVPFLSACTFTTNSRNDGKSVTKSIKTAPFERINVYGNIDVYYTQGTRTSVKVKASWKTLKRLNVKTEDETLDISKATEGWKLFDRNTETVEVYITTPDLTGVEMAGVCDFHAKGHVDTDTLDIQIAGSGDLEMNSLICDKVSVNITGRGDARLKQLVSDKAYFSVTGSGDISSDNVNISYAESSIAGSGNITLNGKVKEHSESIAGSGDVSIK